ADGWESLKEIRKTLMIQASIQNLKKKLLQFVFQFLYILNVVNCLGKRILMKNEWLEIETFPENLNLETLAC
ncbi:MAG: hypothetical protein QF495_07570, partial [SAR324 cluster bacterium]|nr:hypothetical protein [SAR324 cluster bacterium]